MSLEIFSEKVSVFTCRTEESILGRTLVSVTVGADFINEESRYDGRFIVSATGVKDLLIFSD